MRYFILLLWLILGLAYFLLADYCSKNEQGLISEQPALTQKTEQPCPVKKDFYFDWSSDKLITMDSWLSFKNSLIKEMNKDSKIRIKGLYVNRETNSSNYENLGLARANAIANLFGLDDSKYQIAHDSIRNVKYNSDCGMSAAEIRLVIVSEKIKEIDDKTLIYFPVNSVNKLDDREVEKYLDDVAIRILKSGENIQLEGHTDNSGSTEYNFELGMRRAIIIKEYLLSKNIDASRISTNSFGDSNPLLTNQTEEGRAENRRTELRITKSKN